MKTNEVLLKNNNDWLYFSKPHQIVTTYDLDGIIPALQEIENLIEAHDWYAAGFLSYEAASALDKAYQTRPEDDFPLLWFGLYPKPRVIDLPEPESAISALTWSPTTDRDTYYKSIEQIRDHIAHGRTYQVNYTMRLRTKFETDPWNFFQHLAHTQNNHAAYIDIGRYVIASASPELFFRLDGEIITCRPMKGTMPRGRTAIEDRIQAQALKDSEKNRAENVMIVDMIRNDLGRIAQIGSICVPDLFTTEKYPTLWQLTSTVQAKTNASLADIFTALFPCASITGAPKVSTMRIISELEETPRRIYTGTIGYIAPGKKATFNVAIRTALIDQETQTAEYGVGGGIVWDSTSIDEYAEALLKTHVLTERHPQFSLLETMLWTPEEGFFLQEKHIARLLDSSEYFDFSISRERVEEYLNHLSSQFTSLQRVRLLLNKDGSLKSNTSPISHSDRYPAIKVCLARKPVHSGNVYLYHKTTHREVYETARNDFLEYDDVLLHNEKGELTEFTIGNLLVELDGKLYTPPISCGLLAGTFREYLLENDKVQERIIQVHELKYCTKIFLVNSVRKWQGAEIKPANI